MPHAAFMPLRIAPKAAEDAHSNPRTDATPVIARALATPWTVSPYELRRYRYHLGDPTRQIGLLDLRAQQEPPDRDYGQYQGKEGEQSVEGDRASYVRAVLPKEVINGIRAKEHESYEIHSVAP